MSKLSLSRRNFLASSVLVIGVYIAPRALVRNASAAPAAAPKALPPPNAFLRIGEDERVTVLIAHSEMGQGVWTSLPMLLAEELGCDWQRVVVEHAPAASVYAHTAFGSQMTGGSSSTYSEFDRYRQVGAMARDMLVRAAAAQWKVQPSDCRVENGVVSAGPERKASFGKLVRAAQKLAPPSEVKLKDPKEWRIIGKPTKRLDSPVKVTGQARFGMDVQLPGMLTALVARAPSFGAKVKSFQPERAKAVPGVTAVVQIPSGVAVVAEHFWAAKLGRDALEVQWELGAGGQLDSEQLSQEFRALAKQSGAKAAAAGDIEQGFAQASKTLEVEYELPYLAHATMEPLNCTVRLKGDRCEIWSGTQFQTMDQANAAKITGLKPEQVEIHTTFLGGGFGRRATTSSDFVSEAVHLAKALGGRAPVKVVWTREDDIRGGYYRAAWVHRVKVGLGKGGVPLAWQQRLVGQSLIEGTPFASAMIKDGIDPTSVEGVADSPYVAGTKNHRVELHSPKKPIPVLWWRSVGHSHSAFVMESFMDELAQAAGQDPLEYRRKLLKEHPRHLGVLKLAAEKAGWGKPVAAGRKRGIAVHESFGSYVAEVAEVSVEGGRVRVHRVVCAVDCGVCINPAGVHAQLESAVAYALSAALHGEITLKQGRVVESNFHDYPILALNEMPRVDVHIVPSSEKPGGIGEVGVPPLAPAVANAVFSLTGQRLRRLPFRLSTEKPKAPQAPRAAGEA